VEIVRSERETYLEIFKALSDPVRMEMFTQIASAGDDEYRCTALVRDLAVGKSTISYHMRILSQAGLISVRKEGRNFRYRVRTDVADHFLPHLVSRLGEPVAAPDEDAAERDLA